MPVHRLIIVGVLIALTMVVGCGDNPTVGVDADVPLPDVTSDVEDGGITGTVLPPGINALVVVLRNGVDFTSVVADAEGNYQAPNLPAGKYSLQVVSTGFFTDTSVRNLEVTDGRTTEANLIIMRAQAEAATLLGQVVDGFDGAPLLDAEIQIECSTGVCAALSAATDAEGRFSIEIWSGLESNINVRRLGFHTKPIKVRALNPLEKFNMNRIELERLDP